VPAESNPGTTLATVADGIANPTPDELPELEAMALVTPITSPLPTSF
jgi:hypothetical protein